MIDAPIDRVWAVLRDFHDLSWVSHVIADIEKIGEKAPTEPAARRKLNEAILETLIEVDDGRRSLRYLIDDGPPPLAADSIGRYHGHVQAVPVTDTDSIFVLWTSEYETKDDGGPVRSGINYHAHRSAIGDRRFHPLTPITFEVTP